MKNHLICRDSARRIVIVLSVSCILVHLGLFAFLNFRGFALFCNSDVYSDCQVAVKMWEQKTLFPQGWNFRNQYYVIATPVWAALLYGLTGDINTAMVLATELMTLFIMLSFLWLLGGFTRDSLSMAAGCLLLIASVVCPWGASSLNSLLFFSQASFYACYLVTLFVVFGDYTRSFSPSKGSIWAWCLALFLCFATGMQSLRQTAITILPIMAYELFCALRRILKGNPPWTKENRNSLLHAASYALANAAGILVIRLLDIPREAIYSDAPGSAAQSLSQKMEAVGSALWEITSLDYILQGDYSRLIGLVILYMIGLALLASVLWLRRIHRQENGLEQCWILCLIGIAGVLLATVILPVKLRSIYIFMWFPLVAFSGLMLLSRFSFPLKCGFTVLSCLVSLAGLVYCYSPSVVMAAENSPPYEAQLCQWAVGSGYDYIYGEYWGTAPQIAVFSHGELTAGSWHSSDNVFYVEAANTPQDIYGPEENEKAIYVFTSSDEAAGLAAAKAQNVQMEKIGEFGDFRVYTSPVPLMRKW